MMRLMILIVILLAVMYLFVFLGIRKKRRRDELEVDTVTRYHDAYTKRREEMQNRRDSVSSRSTYNQSMDRNPNPNSNNKIDYREK